MLSPRRHTGRAPDPYTDFVEAALAKRGEQRPSMPAVSLENINELLLSAGRAFPLVTLHTEKIDRDVCWIGRVEKIERRRLSLLEISPAATWDDQPHEHRLADITRVNFGGEYEQALYLVGGEPK